jgi:lipopolysaccharide export system protein LptC
MNSITPLRPGRAGGGVGGRAGVPAERMVGGGLSRPRAAPSQAGIARRRWMVRWAKRLLPALSLGLMAVMVLWPEIDRQAARDRIAFRRLTQVSEQGQMTDARYRGLDRRGQPYTVTAATAVQATPARIDLTHPKADVTTQGGAWMMIRSKRGAYVQKLGELDLSGGVTLYRDDGTTLDTSAAAIDLHAGAAAGHAWTHAEGPFGTLDAQGFALLDKGDVIQFTGPAKLVLNGAH